jgi:hypothetical protein
MLAGARLGPLEARPIDALLRSRMTVAEAASA